jgi:pyruvate-ferredoxin/flavodoxin oxidoreductase
MQTAFFALSNVLPRDRAIEAIKHAARKTYGKRGEAVVQRNFCAIDAALDNLHEVHVPASATSNYLFGPGLTRQADARERLIEHRQ